MENSLVNFIIVFYITSLFNLIILRSAIITIFRASVGHKHKYRVYKSKHSLKDRIIMRYIRSYIRRYIGLYNILYFVHSLYLAAIAASIIILPIFRTLNVTSALLNKILVIKAVCLDIPVIVFFFFGTIHNPNKGEGGVVWLFEERRRR